MAGDPDFTDPYLDPQTGILHNLIGATTQNQLDAAEADLVSQRHLELQDSPIQGRFDFEHLQAIHGHLFQDVYDWAVEYRTVGISKNLSQFAHPDDIDRYLSDAAEMIRAAGWAQLDRDGFARAAAETFAYVNQAHPFREGNGRAGKLFMQQVSELSPWRIDYNPQTSGVTAAVWNQASMLSGPDYGHYQPAPGSLVPVFRAMATPRSDQQVTAAGEAAGLAVTRLDYPRSATEASQQYPAGNRPEGRGGHSVSERDDGHGRGE